MAAYNYILPTKTYTVPEKLGRKGSDRVMVNAEFTGYYNEPYFSILTVGNFNVGLLNIIGQKLVVQWGSRKREYFFALSGVYNNADPEFALAIEISGITAANIALAIFNKLSKDVLLTEDYEVLHTVSTNTVFFFKRVNDGSDMIDKNAMLSAGSLFTTFSWNYNDTNLRPELYEGLNLSAPTQRHPANHYQMGMKLSVRNYGFESELNETEFTHLVTVINESERDNYNDATAKTQKQFVFDIGKYFESEDFANTINPTELFQAFTLDQQLIRAIRVEFFEVYGKEKFIGPIVATFNNRLLLNGGFRKEVQETEGLNFFNSYLGTTGYTELSLHERMGGRSFRTTMNHFHGRCFFAPAGTNNFRLQARALIRERSTGVEAWETNFSNMHAPVSNGSANQLIWVGLGAQVVNYIEDIIYSNDYDVVRYECRLRWGTGSDELYLGMYEVEPEPLAAKYFWFENSMGGWQMELFYGATEKKAQTQNLSHVRIDKEMEGKVKFDTLEQAGKYTELMSCTTQRVSRERARALFELLISDRRFEYNPATGELNKIIIEAQDIELERDEQNGDSSVQFKFNYRSSNTQQN